MKYETNRKNHYEMGEVLGTGAEASVYRVKGHPELAAKIYHEGKGMSPAEHDHKLKDMIAMNPNFRVNGNLYAAWPKEILYEGSKCKGFIMDFVPGSSILRAMRVDERGQFCQPFDLKCSITIAINIATAATVMHQAGIIIGDWNPLNCMVAPNGIVTFIDCDSFGFTGPSGTVYKATAGVPELWPAEIQGRDLKKANISFDEYTDRFALAVDIHKLLLSNEHPFGVPFTEEGASISVSSAPCVREITRGECVYVTGAAQKRPKEVPNVVWPAYIQNLIDRAFSYTAATAAKQATREKRPSAREWMDALNRLMNEEMVRCPRCKDHLYLKTQSACPWCAAIGQGAVPPPPPQPAVSSRGSGQKSGGSANAGKRARTLKQRWSRSTARIRRRMAHPIQTIFKGQSGKAPGRRDTWPLYLLFTVFSAAVTALPAEQLARSLSSELNAMIPVAPVAVLMSIVGLIAGAVAAMALEDVYQTIPCGFLIVPACIAGPLLAWLFLGLIGLIIGLIMVVVGLVLGAAILVGVISGS